MEDTNVATTTSGSLPKWWFHADAREALIQLTQSFWNEGGSQAQEQQKQKVKSPSALYVYSIPHIQYTLQSLRSKLTK